MKLLIDNLDMAGPRDYTSYLRGGRGPTVVRRLNQPDEMKVSLVSEPRNLLLPIAGARVELLRDDGTKAFTGYLAQPPQADSIGETERGPWCSYALSAVGDQYLLDRKLLPTRPDFVGSNPGKLVEELAEELCPRVFDFSQIAPGEPIPTVSCGGTRRWSEVAQELAAQTRSSLRVHDRSVSMRPVGAITRVLDATDGSLDSRALTFANTGAVVNEATVLGGSEPAAYINDHFCGDGYELTFSLSNQPFMSMPHTVLEEEFTGALKPHLWDIRDDSSWIEVAGGKLTVAGGGGSADSCRVKLRQALELGGTWQLQHGEVVVDGGSGWVGGLFVGDVEQGHCFAGFRITDANGNRRIQPVVNGNDAGTGVVVRDGCRYAVSTRIYANEHFRLHPKFVTATGALGGGTTGSVVRVVLESREIDAANPASLVWPATVLFDGVVPDAPASCEYVLLASETLHATLNYARLRRIPEVLVRSALPGQPYRTRLVGSLAEGAECGISSSGYLYFYSNNPPAPDEAIVVSYRTSARAAGHASNPQSVTDHAHLGDDGIRSSVATAVLPRARTSEDCALAARSWLELAGDGGLSGKYEGWSDTLPAGSNIFPGDAVEVRPGERADDFRAIVREVELDVVDVASERERLKVRFAQEGSEPLALQLTRQQEDYEWPRIIVDADVPAALPALVNASVTAMTSTTLAIDVGCSLPPGGGVEVRRSDSGWSPEIDRNLVGRFSTQTFTLPRLAQNQMYCFRQYDASVPPRYSRQTTVLYVDVPL